VLTLMREHGGAAIAVSTDDAMAAVDQLAREEGIFACPESATTLAGVKQARELGLVQPDDEIVIVNTGTGLKSIPSLAAARFPTVTSSAEIGA
jgi:threonine synthase